MRWLKALRVTLPVMAILAGTPTALYAATGSIRIVITRAGFIVGHGTGTLHFRGKRYPLRVGGVNFGPLGATGELRGVFTASTRVLTGEQAKHTRSAYGTGMASFWNCADGGA